jgi:alcohol dehydrogenase
MSNLRSGDVTPSFGLLRQPREVVFGSGQRGAAAAIAREIGSRVAVITDRRMSEQPFFNELLTQLSQAGGSATVFMDTEPDLPVANIATATAKLSDSEPEVILGVGGGSCIDLAKLVSLMLTHGGAVSDYYGEFKVPGKTLPVVAVPTTAGTGSEVTSVAVVSDPALEMKVGISSPHLIPHAAVVDPELTASAPSSLTATTGIDALAHLIEAFTSVTRPESATLRSERVFVGKGSLTDHYALWGIGLVGQSLRTAVATGGMGQHRIDMMMASLCGGFCLSTAGTSIAHALQYPVGAVTHTPHGLGIGCLLPYTLAFNRRAVPDEMEQVCVALGIPPGVDAGRTTVTAIAELTAAIGIPRTLADLGVRPDQLDRIAEQSLLARRLVDNNPILFDLEAARLVTKAAYRGDLNSLLS